jgi:Protein of unknown function (DUF3485)
MTRYAPIVLAVFLIVGLTIAEINMTDRLAGTNVSAEQRAALLDKVPATFGDWRGDDIPVDPNVRKTAGAIGAVQREYRNVRTGEKVRIWLIVGHAREVSNHTPDICYPSQGFTARAQENSVYTMAFPDQPKTDFVTNTFLRENSSGQQLERVFWNWYNPMDKDNEGKVMWEAPTNPRWHFGNTRALYKMYLTASMRDPKETADESPCVRFARDFLPEVNKALADVYGENGGEASTTSAATSATEPKADATKPAETAENETAAAPSSAEKELFGGESAKAEAKTKP